MRDLGMAGGPRHHIESILGNVTEEVSNQLEESLGVQDVQLRPSHLRR